MNQSISLRQNEEVHKYTQKLIVRANEEPHYDLATELVHVQTYVDDVMMSQLRLKLLLTH